MGLFLAVGAQATVSPFSPAIDAKFKQLDGGNSAFYGQGGLHPKMVAVGTWDFDQDGGSSAAVIPLHVTLPPNSLITKSYFYLEKRITGTTDTGSNPAKASFGCLTATDILAATDLPIRFNPTNKEMSLNGLQMEASAGESVIHLKANAGCSPYMTLTYGNFTAGKLHMYLEYVVH